MSSSVGFKRQVEADEALIIDCAHGLSGRQVQAEARELGRRSQDLLKRAEKLAARLKELEEKGAGPEQS